MKGNRSGCRRVLAILLSVILMTSNLGLTAFADEVISEPVEVYVDEEVFSSDIEAPPQEIEIQLGDELSEESQVIDEGSLDMFTDGTDDGYTQDDFLTDGSLDDLMTFEEGLFSEPEPVPFKQTYLVRDREITVTADAGVFPTDAVLYVDGIDDVGIAQAAGDALGISASDTVLISHALYSFSGTEMNGTAVVKMAPVGFNALLKEYPDADITSYIMCWDGDYQEAQMILADFDAEQDEVEFALPAMTVYDLLTVARLPEQESTETAAEEQAEPSSDVQEEEVIAQFPEGQIEETAEQTSEDHVEDESTESSVDEAFVEDDTVEFYPVSVVFDAMPETAVVTVWPAATEEVPAPEAIPAQEDGSFALLPGEYTYTAEAEGYVSIENAPFTVTGDEQPMMISFEMEAVAGEIPEPMAFEQSRTVNGVVVTVKADPGVFPAGAELSVETVPVYQQLQADAAVDEVRDENQNVAVSYTFDIKVINPETGEEYQPADGQTVSVSFALAEVADENLETSVYHIDDSGAAEKLDVTQEDEVTASVETEGFSLYTVEFTYNTLEYVLPGDSSVAMSEILSTLGLTGAVEAVEISDTRLFSASNETDEWIVTAHQPFDTTEWMKVTINGVVYEITVTDTETSATTVDDTEYTLFTGFTATDGTTVAAAAFNFSNMVDGDLSSSWHLNNDAQPYYIEFNSDDPIIPKGYIFNTYDANNFKPTGWVLKAKADAGDSWTTLSSKSGSLASGQEFQYACDNSGNNAYKYFRFEVSNSSNNIWLTEIRLYGSSPDVYYTHLTVKAATCTETGIKQDCYQRNDGKYFTDETGTTELAESDVIAPMIPHSGEHHDATDVNIEYWQCSMCSKYFSDGACMTEITEEDTKIYRTITIDDGISGLVTSNISQALAGATVVLTVSPLIDANTLQVNSGSVTLTDVGDGTYTFTVPAADVTVTASILSTYSVTLPANMAIVSATNAADAGGKYISGTVIEFAASFGYAATNVSDGTNTLEPDANGIYTVTVAEADINITATTESSNTLYLATATSDFTAVDGNILIGSTSHTVTIADGANITLNNATITGGIVCEGSATITLVGTNSVSSSAYSKAGIQIGGSGTTLTIKGDGSLNATGGSVSAGIGLGRTWDANATGGSVVIEGGTVTASGGNGIGIGTVGNSKTAQMDGIIIKDGTVNARLGSGYIYNGSSVTIGAIKIYDTIDKVDASAITESVTYMHVENETETDVTASASTHFTIIEDGDRRVITPKDDTDYTITIADDIEHGSIACAAETAKYGDKVTITVTPDFGYRLSRLVVKDGENNDVASTGNTFFMPKGNVTVSAVFEQGTHGTTEFVWGYFGLDGFVTEASIYDGLTTVNFQQGQSYQILKYDEYSYGTFLLDNDTYDVTIPYSGGTGTFPEYGNGTNFNLNDESGFYDITMTDVGNGKWSVSILKTVAVMDAVPDQTYTGSEIIPEPLVLAGSLSLTKGTDYDYSYTDNTNVGTAKVTVTFKGDYASLGSVEKEFAIAPRPVTVAANAQSVAVGGSIAEGTDQAELTGAVEGHTLTAVTLTASNTETATTEGTITPSGATIKNGETDVTDNYAITYEPGILTVKAKYTISFEKGDDGASGSMDTATALDGATYTLPNASVFTAPEGKTFKEWSVKIGDADAVSKQPDDTIEVTADTTVTAVWENVQYTITISKDTGCNISVVADYTEEDGGTPVSSGDTVKYGTVLTVTATAKSGYTLTTTPDASYTVTGDLTITAASQRQTYTLTLNHENGAEPTFTGADSLTGIPYGTSVTVTAGEANEGYEFIGWYQTNGKRLTSETSYIVSVYSAMTLEARYQVKSGVVTFMANGIVQKTMTVSSVTVEDYPTDVTTMYGYELTGWDKTVDEVNSALTNGKNVTVTAKFKALSTSYTVTVYNGDSTEPTITTYTESKTISVTAAAVSGKTFAYWLLDDSLLTYSSKAQFKASSDCVLKAVYTTDAVAAMGTADIRSANYNVSTKKLTFVSYLTVPDSAVITKAGLVAASSTSSRYTAGTELTSDNADYVKVSAKAVGTSAPVTYTWIKTGVNIGDTWYARPYISYTYNGSTEIIYGDMITVNAGCDYNSSEKATAVIRSASYSSSTKKATFVAYLTVPDDGTIVKAGLVAAPGSSFDASTSILTWDTATFKKVSAKATGTSDPATFTWIKTGVSAGDTWYVRAYVIYTDVNGSQHTVYGELVSFTAA